MVTQPVPLLEIIAAQQAGSLPKLSTNRSLIMMTIYRLGRLCTAAVREPWTDLCGTGIFGAMPWTLMESTSVGVSASQRRRRRRPRRRNSRPRLLPLAATRRAPASRLRTERNERPMDPAAARRRGSTNETVNPGCLAPRPASAARTLAARSAMAMRIPGARPSTTMAIIQAGAIQSINQTCTRLTC